MKPEHITAWALEEASAEERERLEAELRDDPKAKQTADETKDFCHFLLAELRDESLALTEEQRERLKAQPMAADVRPDGLKPELRTSWRTGMIRLALAACVVLGVFWTWNSVENAQMQKAVTDAGAVRIQIGQEGGPMVKAKPVSESRLLAETPLKVVDPLAGLVDGKDLASASAGQPRHEMPRLLSLNAGQATMTAREGEELKRIQGQSASGLRLDNSSASIMTPQAGLIASSGESSSTSAVTFSGVISSASGVASSKVGSATMDLNGYASSFNLNGGAILGGPVVRPDDAAATELNASSPAAINVPPPVLGKGFEQQGGMSLMAEPVVTTKSGTQVTAVVTGDLVTSSPSSPMVLNPTAAATDGVAKGLLLAGSSTEIGDYSAAISQYQDVLRTDPYNTAARRGIEAVEKKRVEYFKAAAVHSRYKMLAQVSEDWEDKVPRSDAYYFGRSPDEEMPAARPQLESRSNTETYSRILENELKDVAREPLSTFSIDVDTASYANVRRFLNQNMIPPPDAVRIEELVNYFPTAEEGPAHEAKEPFAVRVEMAPCPWQPVHRLARIAIKGRELGDERKNSNLVFLVDVSGSMNEPNKLPLVQQSLRMLTEQLGEEDRVTMVVYAGSSGLVLPPTSGEKKSEIIAAIDRLKAGGSTHGSAGIQLAYEQAVAGFIKEGVNRVILCTDGDFNVGVSSPEALETLITKKAKSGVFLSVLGFGTGNLKDRTMETLADKGNGNYAYIDSLSEARKVLVEQMSGTLVTIAKDVKIQVEFNPAAVRSYRLIGYENRMLAKEDFNDDTKDAGEIGAGHSAVALYEVVPANLPPGAEPRPAVDGLKYQAQAVASAQLAEAAKSGETMTVKLRYKDPDGDTSQLIEMPVKDEGKTLTASSEEYKYSAAVAGFGLLLRDSAYQGTLNWETVRRLALDGKGADKLGYRGEFLQLIDKARGLKETRP